MEEYEISPADTNLLIRKLFSEATPVIAQYMHDGIKVMRQGVISGLSDDDGLVVSSKGAPEPMTDYLAVSLGSPLGTGCMFEYIHKRYPAEAETTGIVQNLGESALVIKCPNGGLLRLFFSV